MRKGVLGVAVLAGILALWIFLQAARPGRGPVSSAADYPLEEGLRWVYRGAGKVAVVRQIERSVEIEGRRYWEMKFVLPLLGTRTVPLRRTPQGVVTFQAGREHLLMRFPMVPGDAWTIDLPSENEIADCSVVGPEEIEFAGRREMATKLEVRRRRRDGGPVSTDYEWYAPGYGLVKMEVTLGVRARFVLESFGSTRRPGGPGPPLR